MRIARVLTEVFSPPIIVAAFLIVSGAASGQPALGVLAALVGAGIPQGAIIWAVLQKRVTDHHIGDRRQRWPFLIFTLGALGLAAILVWALGANRVILLVLAMTAVAVAAVTVVNLFWKLSVHATTAFFAGVSIAALVWPYGLIAILLAVAVCWSRVILRDHSVRQVIAGAALGAIIAVCYNQLVTG